MRMILTALSVIACVTAAVFEPHPATFTSVFMVLGLSAYLLVFDRRSVGKEKGIEDQFIADREKINDGYDKPEELEKERETLHARLAEESEKRNMLYVRFLHFVDSCPFFEKLSNMVINRTEKTNVRVTDMIYSIADTSKLVSKEISELLVRMVKGDSSLQEDLNTLTASIDNFESTIHGFRQIQSDYRKDMDVIEKTVQGVMDYSANILDLSERTNLLAINASIEAARVGKAGAGFAVIAGEVQKLAHQSQEFADSIVTMIEETGRVIRESSAEQSERISSSIIHMEKAQADLSVMAEGIPPQLELLAGTAEKSQAISDNVSEDLNEVTVLLQYHDAMRQILEHMNAILFEVRDRCTELFENSGVEEAVDRSRIQDDVRDTFTRHFTVRDEWDAIGLKLEEDLQSETTSKNTGDEDLQGDITLF